MGRILQRWPTYALGELEETLFLLNAMEKDARRVQVAIAEGKTTEAMLALSDVRVRTKQCIECLVRAKTGNYIKEQKWQSTIEQPAHASHDQTPSGRR